MKIYIYVCEWIANVALPGRIHQRTAGGGQDKPEMWIVNLAYSLRTMSWQCRNADCECYIFIKDSVRARPTC